MQQTDTKGIQEEAWLSVKGDLQGIVQEIRMLINGICIK